MCDAAPKHRWFEFYLRAFRSLFWAWLVGGAVYFPCALLYSYAGDVSKSTVMLWTAPIWIVFGAAGLWASRNKAC